MTPVAAKLVPVPDLLAWRSAWLAANGTPDATDLPTPFDAYLADAVSPMAAGVDDAIAQASSTDRFMPIVSDSEDEWILEIRAFDAANDAAVPEPVRDLIRELWLEVCLRDGQASSAALLDVSIDEVRPDIARLAYEAVGKLEIPRSTRTCGIVAQAILDGIALDETGVHQVGSTTLIRFRD